MAPLTILSLLLAAPVVNAVRKRSFAARNEASRTIHDDCTKKVDGAVQRSSAIWPNCKCESESEKVFCGTEVLAERRFNVLLVERDCQSGKPYCATPEAVSTTDPWRNPEDELEKDDTPIDYDNITDVSILFETDPLRGKTRFLFHDREYKCCANSKDEMYEVQEVTVGRGIVLPNRGSWYQCMSGIDSCGCMFGNYWHQFNRQGYNLTGKCMIALSALAGITNSFPDDLYHMIQAAGTTSSTTTTTMMKKCCCGRNPNYQYPDTQGRYPTKSKLYPNSVSGRYPNDNWEYPSFWGRYSGNRLPTDCGYDACGQVLPCDSDGRQAQLEVVSGL